jgi:hypothetical protein
MDASLLGMGWSDYYCAFFLCGILACFLSCWIQFS